MKKFSVVLLVCAISITIGFSQNQTETNAKSTATKNEEIKYRHSLGASLFMISNFLE